VSRRDLRAPDPVSFQPTGLEHPPRAQLVLGVLEYAAEGAHVRGLRRLAQRLQPSDIRLDLLFRQRRERELRASDDLPVVELRVAVAKTELGGREPARALLIGHQRAVENRRPVAAVGARIHPNAAPDRSGDGTRELEAAEARSADPMQADGVRGSAAGEQPLALDLRLRELAAELEHEPVEALVRDQ
jgi:hypothetical protein